MQKIHLIAPAGGLSSFYRHVGVENGTQMIALFQEFIGGDYHLTGDVTILDAHEDEERGGRVDDDARACDITSAMADDNVTALMAVRGGAWFTRILSKIDFTVLDGRSAPIIVFGFSELTPLVNIVARHSMARGIHDMGPAFLVYGLKRHAVHHVHLGAETHPTPEEWMQRHLRDHVRQYLQNTSALLRTNAVTPPITAQLVRGQLNDGQPASFLGGNLTVLSTMIGSTFADSIDPKSHWLMIEDFNDKPERLDRFLAHFTLARYWDRCEGLLLGDFHRDDTDLLPGVLAMLDYHLADSNLPVLTTRQLGHIWPMTPLPLRHPGRWLFLADDKYQWSPY